MLGSVNLDVYDYGANIYDSVQVIIHSTLFNNFGNEISCYGQQETNTRRNKNSRQILYI